MKLGFLFSLNETPTPLQAFYKFILNQTGSKEYKHPFTTFQERFSRIWVLILLILLNLQLKIVLVKFR